MAVAQLCPQYVCVACATIMAHVRLYIYIAPARICTPLIVSRSLCSLANYPSGPSVSMRFSNWLRFNEQGGLALVIGLEQIELSSYG